MTAINEAKLSRLDRSRRAAWIWAPDDARIIWANSPAAKLWAFSSVQALIDRPFGVLDPARQDMLAVAKASSTGGEIESSLRFWTSEGRRQVPVLARAWPLDDGRTGILLQLDQAVPRAKTHRRRPVETGDTDPLDLLFAHHPTAIAVFSPRGPCVYANPAYEQLGGANQGPSLAELSGSTRKASQFVHTVLAARTLRTSPTLQIGGKRMSLDMDASRIVDMRTGRDAVLVQLQDATARRQYETRLIDGARELQALLEGAVEAWVVLDDRQRLLSFGGSGFRLFRAQLEGAIGKPWRTVRSLLKMKTLNASSNGSQGKKGETYVKFAGNGPSEEWRALINRRRKHAEGSSKPGYHILFQRIAELKRPATAPTIETPHPAPQTRSYAITPQDIWEQAADALIAHRNFEIVFANSAAARLFGHLRPETLVGRPFLDLFPEDETRAARHFDAPGARENGTTESHLKARRVGGSAITLDAAFRHTYLNGQPIVLMACTDVSDMPDIPVEEPDTQPRALSDWIESVPVPLIAIHRDGLVQELNTAACALLETDKVAEDNRYLQDFLDKGDRPAVEIRIAAAMRAPPERGAIRFDTNLINISGGDRPVVLNLHRSEVDGNRVLLAALTEPPTQTASAPESDVSGTQSVASPMPSERDSELLASISHEMRTPLNAIIGFAEFMKEGRLGPIGNDRYAAYIDDIHMSGQHLLSLVNDLLDMSKIEAGQFELDLVETDPASVVHDTLRIIRPLADGKSVTLIEDLQSDLPLILADARSLRQILLNLASNAVKFNDAGGSVTISARQSPQGEVQLSVEDTGIGMTEEDLEMALKPFRRVRLKGRSEQGTGLGLPLAKALTEANLAEFDITSAPTKGTRVVLTFPTDRVQAEAN